MVCPARTSIAGLLVLVITLAVLPWTDSLAQAPTALLNSRTDDTPPAHRELTGAPPAPLEFTAPPETTPDTQSNPSSPAIESASSSSPFSVPPLPNSATEEQRSLATIPAHQPDADVGTVGFRGSNSNSRNSPAATRLTDDRGQIPPGGGAPPNVRLAMRNAHDPAETETPAASPPENVQPEPDEDQPDQTETTGRANTLLVFGLLFSISINAFLIWITWDTYNRYQDLVEDLDEMERRRQSHRSADQPPHTNMSRDYGNSGSGQGTPLEAA